jgi:hypothetical protein
MPIELLFASKPPTGCWFSDDTSKPREASGATADLLVPVLPTVGRREKTDDSIVDLIEMFRHHAPRQGPIFLDERVEDVPVLQSVASPSPGFGTVRWRQRSTCAFEISMAFHSRGRSLISLM